MTKFRTESDLIGDLQVPADAYYGVQTQRAIENFRITGTKMGDYPEFVKAIGYVKLAAAQTNHALGLLPDELLKPISEACKEVIEGKFNHQFLVDMIQGGAGTSVNMNANEVIANRALEIMGYPRGDYQHCSPNDHVNQSQSTNDAYPTTVKLAVIKMNETLIKRLSLLIEAFRKKGKEFADVIKMGRTQLQDAVPMTLGQEFEAFAANLEEEIARLQSNAKLFLEINMGGTAIGTGLNAPKGYAKLCAENLAKLTGEAFVTASNLVEATPDTCSYVIYSSALKRMAVKLSKICNDLRLLSSGPRAGLNEINLPAMQPGSSIMPGKVNPVIAEVLNQVCYQVIGNDTTITLAVENGQFELNVMEPVLAYNLFNNLCYLKNGVNTFVDKLLVDLEVDREQCEYWLNRSVGIVTALLPHLGYETASALAKEAYETGRAIRDIILDQGLLTENEINHILSPKEMTRPGIAGANLLKQKGN